MSPRYLVLFVACLCAALARAEEGTALLKKMDEGFATVFEKVAPTVVVIEAIKSERANATVPLDFFQRDESRSDARRERDWTAPHEPTQSEGSGFVIRPDGYVVTNRHVVIDAKSIEVRGYDGRRWEATLVADDELADIAVLKVPAEKLPVAEWGDSDALRVGQLVCAIGAPFRQHYSFTCGWVSGKGRGQLLSPASARPLFEDYIQTDAFINPGNSGGPLFDVQGRVVGMNTLVNGLGRGLAFAIPSNLLRDATEQLLANGRIRRPWLGLRFSALEKRGKLLRELFPGIEHGVMIDTVEAGAPASKSELRPGDLVTAVDAVPMRDEHALVRYVQRAKIGQTLRFTVVRRSETLDIPITTGEQPDAAVPKGQTKRSVRSLGLRLESTAGHGVRVAEVSPGSAAAEAGLRVGDVITEVGADPVGAAETAQRVIETALADGSKKGALLQFLRGEKKSWAIIERPAR